jgi:hypothetical protein
MTFSLFDLAFVGSLTGAPALDPDAQAYIAAVEAADTQALEPAVRAAINDFVVGCKADGIWNAIKASCILAGARTLTGALVPLAGVAPTNVGGLFVSGDYDRKTGLMGDGSTKYLNSNRNNNADPQNSNHNAVYASSIGSSNGVFIASNGDGAFAGTNLLAGGTGQVVFTRCRSASGSSQASLPVVGFIGMSRSQSASYVVRNNASNNTVNVNSDGLESQNVFIFRRNAGSALYAMHRIAFYSIGESLDLALLDARVTALINAFDAAI